MKKRWRKKRRNSLAKRDRQTQREGVGWGVRWRRGDKGDISDL